MSQEKIELFELPPEGGMIELSPENGRCHGVETEPGDWMLVIFGSTRQVESELTTHAIRCAQRKFEFKHSGPDGRKWWTSKNGVEWLFAVRKRDLRLLDKPTWSYPILVLPDGERIRCNVGGGSGNGKFSWIDFLYNITFPCVNHPESVWHSLNAIAVKAGSPFDGYKTCEERE